MDHAPIKTVFQQLKKKLSKLKYTAIKQYLNTVIYGAAAAVRKFKKFYPHLKLGERMSRHLRDKYLKVVKTNGSITKITESKVGRPLMSGLYCIWTDEKISSAEW